jgi:hypothetical protein
MDELLKKLLDANILSEDTKSELEVAIKAQVTEAVAQAVAVAEADTKAELTERWLSERDAMIQAIDTKVDGMLVDEIAELKEDIERFRDLEAEYSKKLVEAKAAMKDELKSDLRELVEKIDTFLELRLKAEIEELKEDITTVRQNDFGRRIFESFSEEFMRNYVDEEGVGISMKEQEARLLETAEALEAAEARIEELERSIKMEKVLSPLSGRQREVMEAILKNVKTEQLEEGYKTFIGRVIREGADNGRSEKENKVLAESKVERPLKTATITGDNKELLESEKRQTTKSDVSEWRKLAGL